MALNYEDYKEDDSNSTEDDSYDNNTDNLKPTIGLPYKMDVELPIAYAKLNLVVVKSGDIYPLGNIPLYQINHKFGDLNSKFKEPEVNPFMEYLSTLAFRYHDAIECSDLDALGVITNYLNNMVITPTSGNVMGYSSLSSGYDLENNPVYQTIINSPFGGEIDEVALDEFMDDYDARFDHSFDKGKCRGFLNLSVSSANNPDMVPVPFYNLMVSHSLEGRVTDTNLGHHYISTLALKAISVSDKNKRLVPWDKYTSQFQLQIEDFSIAKPSAEDIDFDTIF